jgi:hypothetical protein
MYDSVRWVILGLLFAGMLGVWLWARRQAALRKTVGKDWGASFRVVQKRWLDKGTGVCLIEAEDKTFLLAYTAGGGVSWQQLEPKPEAIPENRLAGKFQFPEKSGR